MAVVGTAVAPGRHTHAQAVVAGVQYPIDRAQMFKRPVMNRRVTRPEGDADTHRTFAVEFTMRAASHLPEAIDATRHDVVVGTAQ